MDKVKHYLAIAGKHHFWILCAIVVLLTLGSWYTSSANLRTQFNEKKGKIKDAEDKVVAIAGETNHPNQEYKDEMDRMINAYKANLKELWEKQYQDQGHNLQWPIEKPGYRGLTAEFVEQVRDLRPIETTVPYDPTGKVPDKLKGNFKEQYRDFVKSTELPRLAEIIGATWHPAEMGATGGGTRPSSSGEMEEGIVYWHPENQEYLQNTRFDWSKEPTRLPTTLQILYAQEDLWVLETLINIIGKTNQGANARHNAVVKDIKYLKLGADAVGLSGEVMRPALVDVGGNPLAPGAPGAPTTGQPGAVSGPPPGTTSAVISRDPAEGRYVDDKYQAVPPGRLRDAFTSTKPEEAFLAVAKRMPVRMHLVVDQRYINRLLAECGNSNLIVEIRQVRVNRPVFEGGGLGGAGAGNPYASRGGGERSLGGGYPSPRQGGGGRTRGGESGSSDSEEDDKVHHEVDIELYGIVYIYNPVNPAMVETVADATGASPVPPATPPAVAPPAAPAGAPAAAPMDNAVPAPDVVPPAGAAPMPVAPAAPGA